MTEEYTVFVGTKPPMSYVMAVLTQFQSGAPEVCLKARGKSITRAVDVAEIVKNRVMPGVKDTKIEISTEHLTAEDGRNINVSTIAITLAKPEA
jgi:DNA-binding protein Alba